MARRRRKLRPLKLAIAIAILAAGIYGAYRLTVWRHAESVEDRINRYSALIARHAKASRLPVGLVRAIVRAESGGDERALSNRQAKGLMQITPVTLREVRRQASAAGRPLPGGDLYDPDYNLRVGTLYLRELIDRFDGDVYLAVAAYNMGPTRLDGLRSAHPDLSSQALIEQYAPDATQAYCRKVMRDQASHLGPT